MREQHPAIGDCYHVVVEGAGGDRLLGLLDEQGAGRIELVVARHRLARLDMLAGGEGAAGDAIDEYLHPWRAMLRGEPHMVRRAFVPERGRDRRVHRERRVGEGEAELGEGVGPFVAAVGHRH